MINMIKTPMIDLQKTAKISLAKHGVEADGKGGIKVRLVLDHSGSMMPWYQGGAVQRLTEQVLGLASALDDDGVIEVWYFGTDVSNPYKVSLTQDNRTFTGAPVKKTRWNPLRQRVTTMDEMDPYYVGWVDRTHHHQPWGTTNYSAALNAAAMYQVEEDEDEPALVIFQTDGAPNNRNHASMCLKNLAKEDTFFAFVVFGDEEVNGQPTDVGEYMRSLDDLDGRVRDNASVFFTGGLDKYASLPDSEVYDGVLGEFVSKWLPQVL